MDVENVCTRRAEAEAEVAGVLRACDKNGVAVEEVAVVEMVMKMMVDDAQARWQQQQQ